MMPPRRRIWRWSLLLFLSLALAAALWAFWFEPSRLIVDEQRIRLPWGRGALRIAVLTDLHVGSPFNGLERLQRVVEETNRAQPELICILGDLVIQGVKGGRFVPPEQIAAGLGELRAPLGVFAVLGNHDAWLDHARVRAALEQNRITVIEETALRIDGRAGPFWVAGTSDFWTGPHDVAKALSAVKDDSPVILLTHNPDVFPDVPDRVVLTLAGHTHGGQVRLPLVGRPVVPSRFGQRYAAGLVVEGRRHLFVATGVGTSILPVRFRVPPAVSILNIEPSSAPDGKTP